jgi:hypothetical protein
MTPLEEFISAATAQLDLVFERGDWVEIRCICSIGDGKNKIASRWFQFSAVDEADAVLVWAHGLNSSEESPWNVYFGANPRRASGGTTGDDVALARCVFADFDGGATVEASLERVTASGIPDPSFVVETGGGCHFWWRLDHAVADLNEWQATQAAIVKSLDSDKAVKAKPQVMRLAGSRNVKPGRNDFLVTMRDPSLRTHPITAFPRRDQRVPTAALTPRRNTGELGDASRAFLHRGYLPPPPGRRGALFDIACDLKGRGWLIAAASEAIMGKLASHPNGLTAEEIRDIPRSIENAFSQPRTPGYCSVPVIGCTDEETVEAAIAAAIPAPAVAADADLLGLSFVPSGRPDGMLARVSVSRDGNLVDLAEFNLGDRDKREQYAVRAADLLGGGVKVAAVKAWLLRAAAQRATPAAVVQAEEAKAKVSERVITFADCVAQWSQHDKRPTITTMFRPYDDATGGIPCGQLTVFMAQPSAGKTAMMLQLVAGATLYNPKLVTLWGLGEMTPAMIAERMACVGASLIDGAGVTMEDAAERTPKARKSLADLKQRIADRLLILTDLNIDYLEAAVKQTGAGLVVVDYLQLVSGGPGRDRVSDTDAIMARIKRLATTLNVAVVMASSLPRSVDSESKIGSLGRGSAEIDFGADFVYLAIPDEHKNKDGERAVLWKCKKARNSDLNDLETVFDGAVQTFYSADRAKDFPEFASERVAR